MYFHTHKHKHIHQQTRPKKDRNISNTMMHTSNTTQMPSLTANASNHMNQKSHKHISTHTCCYQSAATWQGVVLLKGFTSHTLIEARAKCMWELLYLWSHYVLHTHFYFLTRMRVCLKVCECGRASQTFVTAQTIAKSCTITLSPFTVSCEQENKEVCTISLKIVFKNTFFEKLELH